MTKSILVATLVILGTSLSADNVFAGRRACCRIHRPTCCCAPTPCCNATAATEAPQMAPSTAQTNGGYQSFSYEPGSSPAAQMNVAPAPQASRSTTSFYNHIRADRKALGLY